MIEFDNFLSPGRRGHLVGIGGVSMSSLAEVLNGMGITVTGSDMNDGHNVSALRKNGIDVKIGHQAENITDEMKAKIPAILADVEKDRRFEADLKLAPAWIEKVILEQIRR